MGKGPYEYKEVKHKRERLVDDTSLSHKLITSYKTIFQQGLEIVKHANY